jgi:hypothetical protein
MGGGVVTGNGVMPGQTRTLHVAVPHGAGVLTVAVSGTDEATLTGTQVAKGAVVAFCTTTPGVLLTKTLAIGVG